MVNMLEANPRELAHDYALFSIPTRLAGKTEPNNLVVMPCISWLNETLAGAHSSQATTLKATALPGRGVCL